MPFVKNTLLSAGLATFGTTLTAMILGRRDAGSAAAPLNATSHILYGDRAAEQDDLSGEFTVTGAVLNAGAMLAWAGLQELVFGKWARKGSSARAVAAGTATSAIAYVTDYHVVPERLTPGFEKRLSPSALAAIYGVLALSMAIGVRRGR